MKKKLLILLSVVLVIAVGMFALKTYTKSFSPESEVTYNKDGVNVHVIYGRPSKKGRFIFGREQDKALVPYDKVWRTGANEATIVEFKSNVSFGGKEVKNGKYSLWTIPGPGSWKVILNSETGQWGTNYNDGKNVLQVEVPIRVRQQKQEIFTIYLEEIQNGVNMVLSWDQTEAIIPIQPM